MKDRDVLSLSGPMDGSEKEREKEIKKHFVGLTIKHDFFSLSRSRPSISFDERLTTRRAITVLRAKEPTPTPSNNED